MSDQMEFVPYTLTIFTENSPGVLHRLTVIFTRRKLNIESLTVSETERKGVSRFTILVHSDDETIHKVINQISRVVEVLEVIAKQDSALIYKEIAFFRVKTSNPEQRSQIEELTHRNGAHILQIKNESVVIEKTGSEEDVDSLYLLLEPYGINEFVRSGRIAISKEPCKSKEPSKQILE